jgi:transposase
MDASAAQRSTDVLGRRSGPRRRYSLAEKRAIVEQTRARGASVPEVAQRHGINANLVFGWRRLYQQGLLNPETAAQPAPLLPVQIAGPTVLPDGSSRTKRLSGSRHRLRNGTIEIEFSSGVRVVIHSGVDRATLARVIAVLSDR